MAQAPIKLACEQCAESFERPAKTVNFYARQGIARIKYCSRKCSSAAKSAASKALRDMIVSRKCSECTQDKEISEFPRKGDGYAYMCKICMRAYCRQHYSANRKKAISRAMRNRPNYEGPRIAYIKAAKDVPCLDCGGRFPSCAMDFDHLDGRIKEANVGTLRNSSWNRIKAEIAKCEVVCANCHRVRTHDRLHTRVG